VISRLHPSFRRDFARLPREIQDRARNTYRRFQTNPSHPSLHFKPVHPSLPLWSVRISDSYRAIGILKTDQQIIWVFIGNHAAYDKFLATL
jgi:mRNA-degrading endonuclease RelE of RelBE toxin-antitoxin system